MKLFSFIPRLIPQSIMRQSQVEEVEHEEVFPERELTPFQVRKVNQLRLTHNRALKMIYRELNPEVKGGKQ